MIDSPESKRAVYVRYIKIMFINFYYKMNTVICPICIKRMEYTHFTNVHKCCAKDDNEDKDEDDRRMRREDREDKEYGVWCGFGRRFR